VLEDGAADPFPAGPDDEPTAVREQLSDSRR